MRRFHFHKLRIIYPLIVILSFFIVFYFQYYDYIPFYKPKKFVRDQAAFQPSHLACVQPKVKEEKTHLANEEVLVCSEEKDWVKVNGYEARITKEAFKQNGRITCAFTELVRVNDFETKEGRSFTTSEYFYFSISDFFAVSCSAENGKVWKSTLAGIRKDENLLLRKGWDKLPNDAVKLNVLMLGFDSLSHASFIRNLPQTFKFLNEDLKATILDGYNIVGDGTPQALIPILTGKTEFELPETRQRMGKLAVHVNVYPFIWKDFERNGYATLYAEDEPSLGTFTYRLKGFDAQPVNHYMRTFYEYLQPYSKHPNLCFYSSPRHQVFLKYLTDFFAVYSDQPKFGFAFHSELSHNDNSLVGIADKDIKASLEQLQHNGHFNDTILLVFSDHGNRFSAIRSTQQGKQEERLPFLSIFLPQKFKILYPSAADNVRVNAERLTSPFDIYATLKDLTQFQGAKLGSVSERGISLFSEIPPSRTCKHAFIEPHWCACLTWDPLPTTNDKVLEAANALTHYINSHTSSQRGFCHELKVLSISSAALLLPNEGLMSFRNSYDYDGFLPEFGDRMSVSEEVYQITIQVAPTKDYFHTSNDLPIFEASLTYNIKQDSFSVKIDDISRINMYGDQPHCVVKHYPHLRKFCYCLNPPRD